MQTKTLSQDLITTTTKRCAYGMLPAIFALTAVACGTEQPEEYGLYVWCNGAPSGLYYETPLRGQVERFSLPCIDPEQFAGTGETGGIDLEEWTNDTDNIDTLRSMCVQYCNNTSPGALGNCEQTMGKKWQIENYKGIVVPDPLMLIDDPEHLECELPPTASAAALPWKTAVIPPGDSSVWPSNSRPITLACDDYETCADEFIAPVEVGLYYNDADGLWSSDMGAADYLVTTSTGSSDVAIGIKNSGVISSDANTVERGRVEYSAADCGELGCPFYLANLTLSNAGDSWDMYSDDLMDTIRISDVSVELRQPTLGVWNTSTYEFYIGAGRVELWVTGTLQIGEGSSMEEAYLVANPAPLFGRIGANGEIEITDLSIEDSEFVIEADLSYDTLAGSPPIADHGLGSTVMAPERAGLPISSIADRSWDPDGDIDERIWIVDGNEQAADDIIPTGRHMVELWVRDHRGALDLHESVVMVEAP